MRDWWIWRFQKDLHSLFFFEILCFETDTIPWVSSKLYFILPDTNKLSLIRHLNSNITLEKINLPIKMQKTGIALNSGIPEKLLYVKQEKKVTKTKLFPWGNKNFRSEMKSSCSLRWVSKCQVGHAGNESYQTPYQVVYLLHAFSEHKYSR